MRTARLSIALSAFVLAAAATAEDVHQFRRAEVDAAFARGAPLFESDAYKIHASRRTEPGMAEVHELDTDILYVREGSAVFVTGGTVQEPREIAPREIRGSAITGGEERQIGPGDVVTVPHGTPHWFETVRGPLLYYVVKVTDGALAGAAASTAPSGAPLAVVDLATREGVELVKGAWRYHDADPVSAKHRAPDAQGQPTGRPVATFEIAPRAGWADYDDSKWPVIAADSLSQRRGNGRLSFGWYRIAVVVPERIGGVETAGKTLVFEATVDDYAEVWIDGEIARGLDQRGGSVVAGWNAPNRVVIARDVRPGQRIQLALFGTNGPLSDPPANFMWVRNARLELHPGDEPGPRAIAPQEVNIEVQRRDPALDAIVPANPKLYKVAEGFQFTEGPVWVRDGGYLSVQRPERQPHLPLRPDWRWSARGIPRAQRIRRRRHRANTGSRARTGSTIDPQGRLVIAEHGRHRISRLDALTASRSRGARRPLSRASASTVRTTSSTGAMARCTSAIRRSACRGSSTTRARSSPAAACTR